MGMGLDMVGTAVRMAMGLDMVGTVVRMAMGLDKVGTVVHMAMVGEGGIITMAVGAVEEEEEGT